MLGGKRRKQIGMKLAFTGDVAFHSEVGEDALDVIAKQLTFPLFLNLESVFVGADPRPARQKVLLPAPSSRVAMLGDLPIAAVCVGNNHISDYGDEAAELTMKLCGTKFSVFGAGRLPDPFHRFLYGESGVKVAFLAYCRDDASPLSATAERIGPCPWNDQTWEQDLAWAKERSTHTVAVLHWGDEDTHYPRVDQIEFARRLIDDGCDLVIGAHSHAVQGYECYRGRYIFYGLGHFLFPDISVLVNDRLYEKQNLRRNRWGLLPVFTFTADDIQLDKVWYVVGTNSKPILRDDPLLARLLDRFSRRLQSPSFDRFFRYARMCESVLNRAEEFWLRDGKIYIVARKIRRTFHRQSDRSSSSSTGRRGE